ncbi:MAG: hypothetical protein KGI27_15375 [Thaumarchaeota archaeon]|nr:hypothetical protein [Nitrososphaerota archaeon]
MSYQQRMAALLRGEERVADLYSAGVISAKRHQELLDELDYAERRLENEEAQGGIPLGGLYA